eukprot:2059408-Pyramimonas_sp.AAC.1
MRTGASRAAGRRAGAGSPPAAQARAGRCTEVRGGRPPSLAFAFGPAPALARGRAPIRRRQTIAICGGA